MKVSKEEGQKIYNRVFAELEEKLRAMSDDELEEFGKKISKNDYFTKSAYINIKSERRDN